MKTEITAKEYIDTYEACGWNPKAFSIVLKRFGYSDELIVLDDDMWFESTPITHLINIKVIRNWLDLYNTPIEDLGKLEKVKGNLYLTNTRIVNLGSLRWVGGDLNLCDTSIQGLGNLEFVGGWLDLSGTPLSKKYSEYEIREMVNVGGDIYL